MNSKYLKIVISIVVCFMMLTGAGWLGYTKYRVFFSAHQDLPPDSASEKPATTTPTREQKVYAHWLGFVFKYTADLTITQFEDEKGVIVLAHDASIPDGKHDFQIFATSFDDRDTLTLDKIKKDLPKMKIEDPKEVLIGKEKNIHAIIFFSENETVGKTREMWFAHGAYLYEITARADADEFIGPILETWEFTDYKSV